jgi:hypothetical protein
MREQRGTIRLVHQRRPALQRFQCAALRGARRRYREHVAIVRL